MNPLRIQVQNVRTFARLDLDLPTGCCVVGGENGAGKSTILAAIDVALFAVRGELPPLLTLGEDELCLELTFEHAGKTYRVRRMYSARGRGKTTLDFEEVEQPDGQWLPLTRETAEQTQHLIEQTLGLSRATFRASSFLAQGDGAAFTEAQPRERKAILAEILGLDIWERLLERARADLRSVEDELLVARGRASTLEDELVGEDRVRLQLAAAHAALTLAHARHEAAASALKQAEQEQAENAVLAERAHTAQLALVTAQQDQERARVAYAAAVQAETEREQAQAALTVAAEQAAQIPQLEGRLVAAQTTLELVGRKERLEERQRELEEDVARSAGQADTLHSDAEAQLVKAFHLETHIEDAGTCEHCGQKLGREAALHAAASYREEAQGLQVQAGLLSQGIKDAEARLGQIRVELAAIVLPEDAPTTLNYLQAMLAEARVAQARSATLTERVRNLAELACTSDEKAVALAHAADKVKQAAAAADAAREGVADEEQLGEAVVGARFYADAAATQLDACKTELIKLEAHATRLETAAVELAGLVGQIGEFQRRIDLLKLAERAYGRDGIPALIVESAAIPQLEMEANRIVGELGGGTADCRVELRTQRERKTGGLTETLDIVIVTPAGERSYETFSGGERTRLNLALRIALARLLAHRRGAESRLLAIDEPDGLDAQGMDALAAILQGLAGDFDKILVVSHQPQLATSFDQALMVVSDGERSRLEPSVPLEPQEVAA